MNSIATAAFENHLVIHIEWAGPLSLAAVASLTGPTDYGIYQIYGAHPVYGDSTLLYIGRAADRPFGQRIPEHGWWCHLNPDADRIEVYLGRLIGVSTPDNDTWCRFIELAERLLIHAHSPAKNSQQGLESLGPQIRRVHVVNWRSYRSLMPEVSGARWSDRFDHIPFGSYFSTEGLVRPPADEQSA